MFYKKFIAALAIASLATLAACSTNGTSNTDTGSDTKLAAYGAAHPYPGDLKTDTSADIGAVVHPASKVIRILNFGQSDLNGVDVWINGAYVYQVDSIPPKGYVAANLDDFYDHDGHSFGQSNATVTNVKIRLGDKLWTVMGPITQ